MAVEQNSTMRNQCVAHAGKVTVILADNVHNLGEVGDKVSVRGGYARNWLFPKKLALRATPENCAVAAAKKEEYEKKLESILAQAEERKASLLRLPRLFISHPASEDGVLFGSVSVKELAAAIIALGGHVIDKELHLPHIKTTGEHVVEVILHPKVKVSLPFTVHGAQESAKESE